jgi:hypothetical protein
MPLEAFQALIDLLGDAIVPNALMSHGRCGDPIYAKMVITIGIRVLAGGHYDDIMNMFDEKKNYKCSTHMYSLDTCFFLILLRNEKRCEMALP